MYFFIILILTFISFLEFYFNKKYLFRILLLFITGFLFFIVMGFNSYSPDLEMYRLHYENIDQDYIKLSVEPVIFYLMTASENVGLSFEAYLLFFSFLVFSLFIYAIFKYSPLPVFVFLNFFFIPFFPDITQIRFFLGFSVFLFSIQFFHSKKWLFYCLLVIAILCHLSLITILFFLILRKFKFFKSQMQSNIIIVTGVCLLLFVPKSILEPILIFLNPKYLTYIDSSELGAGTFLGTLVLFVPFFIINNLVLWHYNNHYSAEAIPIKYAKNVPLFMELVQFSSFIILFQYFIRDFSRITQNVLVISTIYFSIILYSLIQENKKRVAGIMAVAVLVSTVVIFYIQFLMINNFEYFEVINQTFTSNYLFDFLSNFFDFSDR
jgi:hypothetical protein